MLVLCVVGKVDKCRINESNKIGAALSIKSYEADVRELQAPDGFGRRDGFPDLFYLGT